MIGDIWMLVVLPWCALAFMAGAATGAWVMWDLRVRKRPTVRSNAEV